MDVLKAWKNWIVSFFNVTTYPSIDNYPPAAYLSAQQWMDYD